MWDSYYIRQFAVIICSFLTTELMVEIYSNLRKFDLARLMVENCLSFCSFMTSKPMIFLATELNWELC